MRSEDEGEDNGNDNDPVLSYVFHVYHDGKFKLSEDNIATYCGGEVLELQSEPLFVFQNIMESLGISLCGHRMWYKLPFETMGELKMLCNGDNNFKRMCDAVMFTKSAEIYLEKDDVDHEENRGDRANVDHEESGDRVNVDDEENRGGRGNRDDENHEMLEEEARVMENLVGFVDEEEHENSETTPQNSDCEDEGLNRYPRCKKGSGDIQLGQVFDSIAEFKTAVVDYALKGGFNVRFNKWGTGRSEVKCTHAPDGCKFRVYCSYEKPIDRYLIKTFYDEHSCIKDGYSKVVKDGVIANIFLNDIRRNPKYMPKAMQEALEERHNVVVTIDQCRKAKKKALSIIQDEQDEQFARIKDYSLELQESNPGSTVEVGTVTCDDGSEKFDRFYVSLEALKKTWVQYCRPIIGIDGCFMKNNVTGQLLVAVGRDANNQIYPVAWGIVQTENTESWVWFIKKLKNDLKLEDGNGFTLISDRQKGLLIAVDQELPKVEHRMCARHIYGNLRRVFPGRELPKDKFWAIAKSFNVGEYEAAIEDLKKYDIRVYDALMTKNPKNCSRAFFSCTSTCEDVSNNFSESYNNAINKAREMPLVEMMETIRRQCMMRNDIRLKKAKNHQGKFSLKVAETIALEEKQRQWCKVFPSGNGRFEVQERSIHAFKVEMNARTCTCRRWSMTGIPCRHALRVILLKKLKAEDYVSDWYLTTTWVQIYTDPLLPANGINLWRRSTESRIAPPPRQVTNGPTKKQKRMKGKNESPKKKKKVKAVVEEEETTKKRKLTRVGREPQCGRCSAQGHNSRTCSVPGVPVYSRPKKQKCDGEGPSQPSQASQSSQLD